MSGYPIFMTWRDTPNYRKAATISVLASACLLAVRFLVPDWPLAPFAILNWLCFMIAGYLAFFRPFRWSVLFKRPDRVKAKIVNYTLLAFTAAGWIAVGSGGRLL
ncbi:hypothetical protein [Novosphingobium album (ex Hu et al. 2023)]|uniref:Uncharacterized protein n=1 Tax=Novosphingobium album (ex Hu et al. 2023) TaxID=2930093 RepID=A0ABT0B203_9SPHN|nr:hypothetical protein [Novosphingobium album (ex Hu et al. 2023)]MCJ2179092.1 hypothetical protein [Novosphingobium album (ex Hu et al. 2023)]